VRHITPSIRSSHSFSSYMSLMLTILYTIILADAVTFSKPGQVNHSGNSNNNSNSRVSDPFNHSSDSPRGQALGDFNEGFAHTTARDGTLNRCPEIVHHDLICDDVQSRRTTSHSLGVVSMVMSESRGTNFKFGRHTIILPVSIPRSSHHHPWHHLNLLTPPP
jgi:hypothetical protein